MAGDLRIDVIIATYNRCDLLRVALDSLLNAHIPSGLDVKVIVVDNNSTDDTHKFVQSYKPKFQGRLKYIFEKRQGKSYALNTGIAGSDGQLVGMIDDDEQVDQRWFDVIAEWFRRSEIDFIGGPYKPNWESVAPKWLPDNCPGVIGVIDEVHEVRTFGVDYKGMLMGGNAVIRRAVFEKVGGYSTLLGRIDNNKKLLACEDEEMYWRIIAAGACGKYVPDLIIYHYIPSSRLQKSYFRKWFYWRGVSKFVMNRQRREQVPHLFGVPRYLFGRAVRDSMHVLRKGLTGRLKTSDIFSAELRFWDLAGWLRGHHYQPDKQ